jgi:hypothetical protein
MTLENGPCQDWTPVWTCDISTFSPTVTGSAVSLATQLLWGLSGRQFGLCEATLRPCRRECYESFPAQSYAAPWSVFGAAATAGWDSSYWFASSCGRCRDNCSCGEVPEVLLPARVNSVVQIKVDGAPLVTGSYRLDNNRIVVRTDGQRWPRCNNLVLDDTHAGTWSITALWGLDVPAAAGPAVGQMACEIARAMMGQDCQLPANVTQLVRQGVTITMPNIQDLLAEGRTGLNLVDWFLAAVNPNSLTQRARTYSVDHRPVRRAGS